MRIKVGDSWLFFDVEGAKLQPEGPRVKEVPAILLLHGGPGLDLSGAEYTSIRTFPFDEPGLIDAANQASGLCFLEAAKVRGLRRLEPYRADPVSCGHDC